MNSRERMLRAMDHKPVDRPGVQYYYAPVGYYEHGEKLNQLYSQYPGDFEPFREIPIPVVPKEQLRPDGSYHSVLPDEWGTLWEYRVFGMMGHVVRPAIEAPADYAGYRFPEFPLMSGEDRRRGAQHKQTHYFMRGDGFSFLERLSALRGTEDALIDLVEDEEEVNRFLDRLTAHYLRRVHTLLELGVDCISFGDDYGTQNSLLLSKELFRHGIKPRLKVLMDPIRQAGVKIHFHSCGKVDALFEDFKDLGVTSIWPQLPLYNLEELAAACRQYHFAIALHTDRADTMTLRGPDEVKALVAREFEIFRPDLGGAWFYIEADTGFPFQNIQALVEAAFSF